MENYLSISTKERRGLNFFWLGFALFTLSFTISTSTYVNYIVCQLIQMVGIALFVPSAISLIDFKIKDKYLAFLFYAYCIWLIFIIARIKPISYEYLKEFLFNAWFGIWIYFSPLFLLFPKKLLYYRKLFDVILLFGVACVFYDLLFLRDLIGSSTDDLVAKDIVEYFSRTIAIPCGFIMLTYSYHNRGKRLIAIFVLFITVVFALIRARRGLVFMSGGFFLLSYLMHLAQSNQKFLTVVFSVVFGAFITFFGFEFANSNQDGRLLKKINERGMEDTRATVEDCFYDDMETMDWIIGKGYNGGYFCPGIDNGSVVDDREVIETDYLNLILKGGVVSVIFLLLITIPAIFKGLFYSKNLLSKASAVWIFWCLLNMYPATVVTFTLQYILVWICIGICYSKTIRNIPEKVLVNYFKYNR